MIADLNKGTESGGIPMKGGKLPPSVVFNSGTGASRFNEKSDGLLQAEKRIDEILDQVKTEQALRLPTMLASHIRTNFEAAKNNKQSNGIDNTLDSCLRARKGEYNPDDLRKIRQATPGGSEAFMMVSNNKSRGCEAILKNTMLPAGEEKPWTFGPSPVPDLPEAVSLEIENQLIKETTELFVEEIDSKLLSGGAAPGMLESVDADQVQARKDEFQRKMMQEAVKRAKEQDRILEKYVEDQLVEGQFYEEFAKFLNDISIFPTAFLKGPIIRRVPGLDWVDDGSGNKKLKVISKISREYERVSPYDIFPSPGAKNLQDGYICERQRMKLGDLQEMIGVEGYDSEVITAVMAEYGEGGYKEILPADQSRAEAEGRPNENMDPEVRIDAIEYWGSVQGKALLDWGMSSQKVPDPSKSYQISALLVGKFVVMARINPHPFGRNPYYCASFSYNNDSIWGESPIMIMTDDQKACNSTARALFNRMGFASGPIIEILTDRLAPGEDPGDIRPWMRLKTKSDVNAPGQAVYITDINPYADMFLKVYDFFEKRASQKTGIPDYISAASTSDAHKTSSGFAMQLNNMNAMMRNVVMGIDNNVIKKVIFEHWLHLMLYDREVPKTGDVNIRARASDYIIAQEQLQLRRNEFLQATTNDYDMEIIGKRGRANMLRENTRTLKYDNDIVPSDDEMVEREGQENQTAQLAALLEQAYAEIDALKGGSAVAGGSGGMAMNGGGAGGNVKKGAVIDNAGGIKGKEIGRMMR